MNFNEYFDNNSTKSNEKETLNNEFWSIQSRLKEVEYKNNTILN